MADIASEHVVWCAENEFSPREVVESVGLEWPAWKAPTWEDAVYAVQVARVRLIREHLDAAELETERMRKELADG